MITFDKDNKILRLDNGKIAYIMHINEYGMLVKLYFGKSINGFNYGQIESIQNIYGDTYSFFDTYSKKEHCNPNLDPFSILSEVPSNLRNDKREPLVIINHSDNSSVTDFRYVEHEIFYGRPTLEGLPHARLEHANAQTLHVTLKDVKDEVYLHCYYTILKDLNVIIRHNEIVSKTHNEIKINRLFSQSLDLPSVDYTLISLHGAYASDKLLEETEPTHNKIVIEDVSGGKGFNNSAVYMLKQKDATLDDGEVIGGGLIYSNNFKLIVHRTPMEQIRLSIGMNDYNFEAILNEGEKYLSPESFIAYTDKGINALTQTFHDFTRQYLLRKLPNSMQKSILLNSWEGCFFDFNTEKIINILDRCKEMGVNLFVLDDGWFRNSDTYGLGDWVVDLKKIDLKKVIHYAHSLDIKFGLWVEPEQISFDSNLYRKHPEYALFDPSIEQPTTLRHQFVLDVTNPSARNAVFDQLTEIFDNYEIDYCKWDFNRMLTEAYSKTLPREKQKEIFHLFALGSYELLNRFITRYPNIVLETCSGGGGRFDLGMAYYSHQIWGSDETDPIPRTEIQYSANMFYPLRMMGAHVSNRKTLSIKEKGAVAMFGTFGYELDPTKLSKEAIQEALETNEIFLRNKEIIDEGDYYSLISPFDTNFVSWEVIAKDASRAIIFFLNYRHINWRSRFLKVRGLDPKGKYLNTLDDNIYLGEYYMNVGLNLSMGRGNFTPTLIELIRIDEED